MHKMYKQRHQIHKGRRSTMAKKRKRGRPRAKWGKIGAPKSAKRKAWMRKIARKRRR